MVEGGKTAAELEEENARNMAKPASRFQKEEDSSDMVTPQQLLAIFKDKLKARGARGIVGI